MPRKGWVVRRRIPGDPVYGSDLVQKFISSMMYDGKRSTAQTIFYDAMDQVAKKSNDDAFKLFKKAVEYCKPTLEVKTRRDFTSRLGFTLSSAFLNTLSGSSPVRSLMMSKLL